MELFEAIRTRRSIRNYKNDPVDRELVERVVDAGRQAATGGNRQPWEFYIVTDPARRGELAVMGGSGRWIAQSPVCIVIFTQGGLTPEADCAAAAQNMLLAAHALGLGTCWVANPRCSFADRMNKFMNVPEAQKFFGMISLGYPDESPQKEKRPLNEVMHWEE